MCALVRVDLPIRVTVAGARWRGSGKPNATPPQEAGRGIWTSQTPLPAFPLVVIELHLCVLAIGPVAAFT